ncbi:MAG: hypothetical protein ACO3XO_04610 [Bdellovibrionota bacterium]
MSIILACIATCLGTIYPAVAGAEFLKSGPFTYLHSGGRVGLIVVPDSEEVPGIFIIWSGEPIPLQLFDPELLANESSTRSLFLEYDPEHKTFTSLVIGEEESAIRGNFTLVLGQQEESLRLAVSTSSSAPLVTLLVPAEEGRGDLLGFLGLTYLFNETGEKASKFQAWTVSTDSSSLVKDYSIGPKGELLLGETPIPSKYVGVPFQNNHICSSTESVLLSIEKSDEAQKMDKKDLPSLVYAAPFEKLDSQMLVRLEGDTAEAGVPLSGQEGALFLLNPASSQIFIVRPHSEPFTESGKTYQICISKEYGRVHR